MSSTILAAKADKISGMVLKGSTTEDALPASCKDIRMAKLEKDLSLYGITAPQPWHNAAVALLCQHALFYENNTILSSTGALCCLSGERTGRSPKSKRTVFESSSKDKVWWSKVNIPIEEKSYLMNRERAIDYINLQERIYVTDAFAGWDPEYRIRIRVITTRAYHAIFMTNLLIRPTLDELETFEPDFILYNAGAFPSDSTIEGTTDKTLICIDYRRMEMVILGSEYAGEMKKGIFTLMMYLLPQRGVLPLHSSCNVGYNGDVTLFFGLSGTGKTTLSSCPSRSLIGDDEHAWTAHGVFNIEGGCYAKCEGLRKAQEPEIFDAIRFGAILENVICDSVTHEIDYDDCSITENTRCAYPLEHISDSIIPSRINTHPGNIIFLTYDAFGVFPSVSKLSIEQAMYHFISGYTSKVSGTEMGITKPTTTFSACYAEPFLALHPTVYTELLGEKLERHGTDVWLINTGRITGLPVGGRIPLNYTRTIIEAIHNGSIKKGTFEEMPIFGLKVPKEIEGIPREVSDQSAAWKTDEYLSQVKSLAEEFINNFKLYQDKADHRILGGGPTL